MTLRVCVYGLWHLGAVTAACLAEQGLAVIGLDDDLELVRGLGLGLPPVAEPGLADLVHTGLQRGNLEFTIDAGRALSAADVLWVTFDTPVDDDDRGDVASVSAALERVRAFVARGTLVVVSSQVPVGFTSALERTWRARDPSLEFACSPENLRLGQALEAFRAPGRVVVGLGRNTRRERIEELLGPARERIVWMSIESAEMTKHALNGFLAASVAYTNEVARICEAVGADAAEVERGLRSEPRIGRKAYVTPGAPIGGGTLARDVAYMKQLAADQGLPAPVLGGILESNRLHMAWADGRLRELLAGVPRPRVALLGLTYKVGTDTLRRSTAIELARRLAGAGIHVQAFDPAIHHLPPDLRWIQLALTIDDALAGSDAAVLGTPWPEFAAISADQLARTMRRAQLVDQTGFLAHLATDGRLQYIRVGSRAPRPAVAE